MGLALVFFLVSLLVGSIVYISSRYESNNKCVEAIEHTLIGVCTSICTIGVLSTPFIVGFSYSDYLDNRAFYDATVEQYRGAVEMYKDYAVIDMKKTHEYVFTDLKYQGYQKHMAENINDLKRQIIRYNKSFILKKIKNDSWFFNWYIIANDPDMKIIRMIGREKSVEKKAQLQSNTNSGRFYDKIQNK